VLFPSLSKNLILIVLFSVFDFPHTVRLVAAFSPKFISLKSRLTLFPIPSTASSVILYESPVIRFASNALSLAKALGVLSK
jgi:hypothetical protein